MKPYETWTPGEVAHACRVIAEHSDRETGLLLYAAADKLFCLLAGISAHKQARGNGVPVGGHSAADVRLWELAEGTQ